jgi:hypothetical protein
VLWIPDPAGIMTKPATVPEDTLVSLLDRIGILREDLISAERLSGANEVGSKSWQRSPHNSPALLASCTKPYPDTAQESRMVYPLCKLYDVRLELRSRG